MGFLSVQGGVLTYNQYKSKVDQYKKHGLNQFVSIYNAHKERSIPLRDLKWGEEMEYQLYVIDEEKKSILLSNRGPELIQVFNSSKLANTSDIILMPEFGGWMIEAVPSKPYNSIIEASELLSCEEKLHHRREVLDEFCNQYGIQIVSLPNAPSLGTENHIVLDDKDLAQKVKDNQGDLSVINQASQSRFVIDKTINNHPRFSGLVKSIRERRGSKINIKVPIYQDTNTNMTDASDDEPYPGFIYMDAMHFGMGQCCLQITYECQTINHARYLHDMLLPFTGIMAALSASGPIQKGKLSDYDLRWTVIEQSVDCRTEEERDPNSSNYVPKSRYSAMNHYISNHQYVKDEHNDAVPIKYDQEHKKLLQEKGQIDDRLAEHISRIFSRDPVPSYEGEFIESQINDDDLVSHFENLQSTNWNSLRFKPPPSQTSKIGWRVEFRTMDIQLTDFENTSLIVTMGLITNVINHFNVDFILPVTMADENMKRAHFRDALLNQKFWFKTDCLRSEQFWDSNLAESDYLVSQVNDQKLQKQNYEELFIHEILMGKGHFPGLMSLIRKFMEIKEYSSEHVEQIEVILDFLRARAKGEVPTGARFIREYVLQHPLYKKDSMISKNMQCCLINQIVNLNKESKSEQNCNCAKTVSDDTTPHIDCCPEPHNCEGPACECLFGKELDQEKQIEQPPKKNYNLSKDKARSVLLGEQWFQGKTGYKMTTPKKISEEVKSN